MRDASRPWGGALADDPLGGGIALLDRHGVVGLGRVGIFDEQQRGPRADGQLADEPVVSAGVAEDPAAAVHVDDDRQRAGAAGRPDDPDAGIADLGGDGDPLLFDRQQPRGIRLQVVEHLARSGGLELVDERRNGSGVDDALCGGLEDDAGLNGHGDVLSW
jgi:hypothetical protein